MSGYARGLQAMMGEVERRRLTVHGVRLRVADEELGTDDEPERRYPVVSVSKAVTGLAVGLAVSESRLRLADRVSDHLDGPRDAAGPTMLDATVRDLLRMTSGHLDEPLGPIRKDLPDGDWLSALLHAPAAALPGTRFHYHNGPSYVLSALIEQVTGDRLLDYVRPRLLEPLGLAPPRWESCPRGTNVGAWGLDLTLGEMLDLGQLFLDEGLWHGNQVVPAEWVVAMTTRQMKTANEQRWGRAWQQGYGYHMWVCSDSFFGFGAGGQLIVVRPDEDLVVAMTASVDNAGSATLMDLVSTYLLHGA